MIEEPLVSVGIPCYNRPEGLRRTLECICGQTYRNLEIIISDNCSPDPEVEKVCLEFSNQDFRIRYHRQSLNQGPMYNYKFVLEKATGEYFMWAADDDEWLPKFIECNLENIGTAGSCFTGYIIRNRYKNQDIGYKMPEININYSNYCNAVEFLKKMTPSMIYGLHRRENIMWVIGSKTYDFWDCYFCLRQIIEYNFNIICENLFIAGVDDPEYNIKPANPKKGQLLDYLDFYNATRDLIFKSDFKITNKLSLLYLLVMTVVGSFSHFEKKEKPLIAVVARILFLLMRMPLYLQNMVKVKYMENK